MKLIILGNGFDLHHKFKTSFSEFRFELRNSNINKDKVLISKIDKILGVNGNEQKTNLLWNDFETIMGGVVNSDYKKHIVNDISAVIEEFTQRFYEYLLKISKVKLTQLNKKILKEFENVSSILTFNYTSFYSEYTNGRNIDIFHIHGNLTENDLPIIGFYYPGITATTTSVDYSVKFRGKLIHKPALAYKQNETDFENRINSYLLKWRNKITEIVVLGYSFGASDEHIYRILNEVMTKQIQAENVPTSRTKEIRLIKFKIYSYNDVESNRLIDRLKKRIVEFNRRFSVNVTGVGFKAEKKDILTFELLKY